MFTNDAMLMPGFLDHNRFIHLSEVGTVFKLESLPIGIKTFLLLLEDARRKKEKSITLVIMCLLIEILMEHLLLTVLWVIVIDLIVASQFYGMHGNTFTRLGECI